MACFRNCPLTIPQYNFAQFLLIQKWTHTIIFQFDYAPFFNFLYFLFPFVIPLMECFVIHRNTPLHAARHWTFGCRTLKFVIIIRLIYFHLTLPFPPKRLSNLLTILPANRPWYRFHRHRLHCKTSPVGTILHQAQLPLRPPHQGFCDT